MRQIQPAVEYGPVGKNGAARGILKLETALTKFRLERNEPCQELRPAILHYWRVEWDLENEEFVQELIPNPNVAISFEDDEGRNGPGYRAFLTGVWPCNYQRRLLGKGQATGISFQAAQYQPWLRGPVSGLTGRVFSLTDSTTIGPSLPSGLTQRILAAPLDEAARICDSWLLERRPQRDPWADRLTETIDQMRTDRDLNRTDLIARYLGVEIRTLQRLFLNYVGVGPKWIILRFRVHEAIDRLSLNPDVSIGDLAHDLGYYDQAHFVHEFKRMTGSSPDTYKKTVASFRAP